MLPRPSILSMHYIFAPIGGFGTSILFWAMLTSFSHHRVDLIAVCVHACTRHVTGSQSCTSPGEMIESWMPIIHCCTLSCNNCRLNVVSMISHLQQLTSLPGSSFSFSSTAHRNKQLRVDFILTHLLIVYEENEKRDSVLVYVQIVTTVTKPSVGNIACILYNSIP